MASTLTLQPALYKHHRMQKEDCTTRLIRCISFQVAIESTYIFEHQPSPVVYLNPVTGQASHHEQCHDEGS